MIRSLLVAMAASQAAAGRGLLDHHIRILQVGTSFCTYSPNTTCYLSGWPTCCGVDSGASCPDEQPPCDYCEVGPSADPSLGCATAGRFCQLETGVCNNKNGIHPGSCAEIPFICTMDYTPGCGCDGKNYSNACEAHSQGVSISYMGECNVVPEEGDGVVVAETSSTPTSLPGSSYCTYGPNTTCYESGWPSCCGDDASTCPEERPSCEIDTPTTTSSNYCEIGPSADPSLDCGTAGQFCQLEMGVCNNKNGIHPGICVESPVACTEEWNPACGCDGETYGNSCGAYSAGVSVSYMGECTEEGDGVVIAETSSTPTSPPGSSYCTYSPDTTCYESGWPSCCEDASTCPEEKPACEIDTPTTTSSNYCEIGPSADPSFDCGTAGQFCQLEMGVCNNKNGIHPGICVETPVACTADWNPACGCDGETYGNSCGAYSAGVSVSYMGECTEEGDGVVIAETSSTPTSLLGSSYCTYSPDTTCYLSGWPTCCGVDSGASCPDEQPPCDYCEVGPSADPSLSCVTTGKFCQLDKGVCNNKAGIHPGSCVETPDMCTMDMNPACGCDGKNYSNPCEAHSQGVSISYMGECNVVPEEGDGSAIDDANPSSSPTVTGGNKTSDSIEGIPRSAASVLSTLGALAAVVVISVSTFLN